MLIKTIFKSLSILIAIGFIAALSMSMTKSKKEMALKNEIQYVESKISLNFAGLEEFGDENWLKVPNGIHYKADVYLSDINLDDVASPGKGKIIVTFENFFSGKSFKPGTYRVKGNDYEAKNNREDIVYAGIINFDNEEGYVEVEGGIVEYSGTYPNMKIDFDLVLSNGKTIKGNYDKGLKDFKYSF